MDNRRHQVLLMSLFFSMLIGCSDKQLGKHAFEVYSDGDIPVAANTGGPKYGEDLFKFEKVVTLQEDPGRPDSYLYQSISFIRTVKGFFLGDDGRYYVGDSGGARIAVYDASGRYERSIGRQGEGPGEFVLCELYELADGVLKILDYNLHRTTCYGTDGTLIEMIRGGGFHFPERDMVVNLTMPSYYDENGYLWMGAGLLTLSLLLLIMTQETSSRATMLFFGVCLAGGVALLVRGCLLRRAERRYLSKEKGIRFSGRRRSKFTKSILLGIGFVLLSLFFLYMVVEEYRRANYIPQMQLLFFAVLFTLGVVFFVRAGLVRRPQGRRAASSAKVDASESNMASS